MGIKNNTLSQNSELVMVIAEENYTLRTLFDNIEPDENGTICIPSHSFKAMAWRSRYNPELVFYKVNCEAYKRYGYTADELFDEIEEKYIKSHYQPLDELFTFIERI